MAEKKTPNKKAPPKKRRASNCKIIIDDEFLKKVESMAAKGSTQEEIAYNLGISPQTLSTKKGKIEELNEAIKRGQAKGIATVENALFKQATAETNPNVTAMLFFLCNRAKDKWRHVSNIQHDDTNENLAKVLEKLFDRLPD